MAYRITRLRSFGLLCVVAVAVGCGTGDGTAGMSGRQIVRGHDVADLFFADANTLAFTRQALNPTDAGPQDLWIYGLGDAAPDVALSGIDWAPPVWWANVRVGRLLETGPSGLLFFDFPTRQRTDLAGFGGGGTDAGVVTTVPPDGGASADTDAGSDDDAGTGDDAGAGDDAAAASSDGGTPAALPIPSRAIVVRSDGQAIALTGTNAHVVAVGPPAALQTFRVPATVFALDFLGSDLVLLAAPDDVTAPLLGIYRLAVDAGQWSEIGAPRALADWGPVISGCNGFGPDPCGAFKVIGCDASVAACPGTGVAPCAIVFAMNDPANLGQTATYAYDVNAGTGSKLPGQGASHFYVSPDNHLFVWDDSQIVSKRYWDLCSGTRDFCPMLAGPHLLWRGDSQGFATLTDDGQLSVASFSDHFCTGNVATSLAYTAFYSPSGGRIAWLTPGSPSAGEAGLWLANNDGSGPVLVDAGMFSGARFSPDESKILVSRTASSSVSLAWIDMMASPPAEHPLVDNYGGFSRLGNRRVLLVDSWNTQDATGDLTLIDMTTGARSRLGRAVASFAVSGGTVDDAGTNVAYVAHSRVASDRDGLWLTPLPP